MNCRVQLSSNLGIPNFFSTSFLPLGDKRMVSTTLPKLIKGMVIHKHRFIRGDLQNNSTMANMCLECTILDMVADPHTTYQNFLFTSECIISYLSGSRSNVVVCELEDACTEGYESFGFPMSQTQPTLQFLSQTEQMGYGLVSESDRMGYGLSEPL